MPSETKQCQNCKTQFTIELEDFEFYEKIKVPPPTWCSTCRSWRRITHNISIWQPKMYQRICNATGNTLISIYPPETDFPVYDRAYWFSDKWDPMEYGVDYDFSKPFFVQFQELQKRVVLSGGGGIGNPHPTLSHKGRGNSS